MRAYEYKLVDGSLDTVEKIVNQLAQDGWALAAPIQVRATSTGAYYTQAMTRPKEYSRPANK